MRKVIGSAVSIFIVGLCMCLASSAFAVGSGGFENQVLSGKSLGMGNAFAGQADDATAVYFNPAGITQLDGVNLSLGVNLLSPTNKFKATSAGDVSQDTKDESFVIPDLYVTWKLNEKLFFGFGAYSNFGLATDWGKTGSLKYLATRSELSVYSLAPCAAYKISDKLSAGIGVEYYMLSGMSMKKQLSVSYLNTMLTFPSISPDGEQELSGNGGGFGGSASMLYSINEKHKVGATYRSAAKIDIDGELKFKGLDGASALAFGGVNYKSDAESSITLPPRFLAGYSWQATDKMIINADYEWTGWSTYDELVIEYKETDATRLAILSNGSADNKAHDKKQYRDVSSVGLGTEYKLNDTWKLRGGWFYFESPVTQLYYSPAVPDSAKNCVTVGCGYTINNITIDAGYGYLMGKERKVVNGTSDGKYSSGTHLLALNANYKF